MAVVGEFDPQALDLAEFDYGTTVEGWYDPDLISDIAAASGLLTEARIVLQAVNRAGTF